MTYLRPILRCAALIVLSIQAEGLAAQKPDVLVVLCDQWNPRYLSWESTVPEAGRPKTPTLDKIAAEGMIFDACYVTSPVCMPSRVSLITGLYPHNMGLWSNANGYCLSPEIAPMFRDIRSAGYTTAQIGKLHWYGGNDWQKDFKTIEAYHDAMGLDTVEAINAPPDSAAGRDPYSNYLRDMELLKPVSEDLHSRFLKNQYEPRPSLAKPEDYHDMFVARLAAKFITEQPKDKPMCLVASFHSPHPPLDAPGAYATMYDPEKLELPSNVPSKYERDRQQIDQASLKKMVSNYLGKMTLADQCMKQLVDAMRQRGTWENTLFVFTADHGEMMGAHGLMSKGRFYEESARVPLVVRWPGQVKAGRTPALSQMFDVYPTIVEAIGGQLSPGRFATSLMPVATGKAKKVRDVAISEIGKDPPLDLMARTPQYKWFVDSDGEHLIDLQADPMEMKDLAKSPEHQKVIAEMRTTMLDHLRSTQANAAVGSISKVQRIRSDAEKEGVDGPPPKKGKKKAAE